MSYAIIRNENYTRKYLPLVYRHNERKNINYSNKNIKKQKVIENYALKKCNSTYLTKVRQLMKKHNLKGRIISTTNVLCEYIITSDKEFFERMGENETKRFFEAAYDFVKEYQGLGDGFIISANIHNDEETPHMHLVYIPVVHKLDKKSGKMIDKIACSEFWKGKDSYHRLQDSYYNYMKERGFELERGNISENKHIPINKLKQVTNFEMQEMFKDSNQVEQEIQSNDIEIVREHYCRVIKKYNILAKRYTKVKNIVDDTLFKVEEQESKNYQLNLENERLVNENNRLLDYIEKTYEYISILVNIPKESIKRMIDKFIEKIKERK